MATRTTLKDVAQAVNKSVAAVSKALNDHADIAPDTRNQIKAVAVSMGYQPNITAQRLKKQRTDTIALVLPILDTREANPYFTELLAGLADEATTRGFDLITLAAEPNSDKECRAYQRLNTQRQIDGMVLTQLRHTDWRQQFLTEVNLPYVPVGYAAGPTDEAGIWVDAFTGLNQAVNHLLSLAHSDLAFVLPPAHLRSGQIFAEGAEQAVQLAYPHLSPPIMRHASAISQQAGYNLGQQLLSHKPPAAIIAGHDLLAMGCLAAARDQGFEPGQDIAIIGFGDILLAKHTRPSLTTLREPTYAIGKMAAKQLIDQITNQSDTPTVNVLEPSLIIRQSTDLALWV